MNKNHKACLLNIALYLDSLKRVKKIPEKPDPIGYIEISDEKAFKISENLKEIVNNDTN